MYNLFKFKGQSSPMLQTAQAETNNPQWAKAIEIIYPKAREMMSKPRYWHVAFPLVITSLCVAPQTYFLKNWVPCLEAALSKVKVFFIQFQCCFYSDSLRRRSHTAFPL